MQRTRRIDTNRGLLVPEPDLSAPSLLVMRDHRTLKAWQEARTIVIEVVRLSRRAWKPWSGAMFSQLQRSSLSVQLNLAEGYAYAPSRSALRFWRIAFGSAVETGDLLRLLGDAEVVDQATAQQLARRNDGVQQLIGGMLRKMGASN